PGLLADCRRFGWSRVISTGNEAVIVAADVLEYLIDDPVTRVIAMFLESVRQPHRVVAELDPPAPPPADARGVLQGAPAGGGRPPRSGATPAASPASRA